MNKARLQEILSFIPRRRLLVLGDLMLDRYWWGETHRLSPEAPVPVVRKQTATVRPGGAANTAANLTALGASVDLIGMTGNDTAAEELRQALQTFGIDSSHLFQDETRPTTSKTRIVALHQHVVRVDEEETTPVTAAAETEILRRVMAALPRANAIVISDYAKGLLTPALLRHVFEAAAGKPVFVDPKGPDYARYRGATLLKPNRHGLAVFTARHVANHEETLSAATELLPKLGGTHLLVTEAEDGMTLFRPDTPPAHTASIRRQAFDVTGAGDTVLATLAAAVTAGASYEEAMILATHAAALAVATVGTAAITAQMLREAIESDLRPA